MNVRTRILPATNTKGRRIKVTANGKTRTYSMDTQETTDSQDKGMFFVSKFMNDCEYSAIGSITRIKDIGTMSALYKVKDYTEMEMGNVLATAEMDGEGRVLFKVQSTNAESKWLIITTDQLRRMMETL